MCISDIPRAPQVALLVKNQSANAGDARDVGSIPRLGRSPRVGNGNPIQYSCLENSMSRGPWRALVHGATKSWKPLSTPINDVVGVRPATCCCCCRRRLVASVVSDPVQPHRWQPTSLPRPWDSPGKNTGVGCHFLLQCRKVKSESEVAQSCPTLRDTTDCSPPGSSIHGIFQARGLEWGATAFSGPAT